MISMLFIIFTIFSAIIATMVLFFLVSKGKWMSDDEFTTFSKGKRILTLAPLYILAFSVLPMSIAGTLSIHLIHTYTKEIKSGIKTNNTGIIGTIIMWLISISTLLIVGVVLFWFFTLSSDPWWIKNKKDVPVYELIIKIFTWTFSGLLFAIALFSIMLLSFKILITNIGIRKILPKDATKLDLIHAKETIKMFHKRTVVKNSYTVSNVFIK